MTDSGQERRVRRLAQMQGKRLWKVRPGSPWDGYGPYAVIDTATNGVAPYGMTLTELENWLTRLREAGRSSAGGAA